MVEYILGIGSLNEKECDQVINEVSKRKEELKVAQATITKEINILNTIQFQASHRQTEMKTEDNQISVSCKECACTIRGGHYYPCLKHQLSLPLEIKQFLQENKRTWGS